MGAGYVLSGKSIEQGLGGVRALVVIDAHAGCRFVFFDEDQVVCSFYMNTTYACNSKTIWSFRFFILTIPSVTTRSVPAHLSCDAGTDDVSFLSSGPESGGVDIAVLITDPEY
jgi:hypothetical protein